MVFHPPDIIPLFGPFMVSPHGVAFLVAAVVAYITTRRRVPARYHRHLEDVLPFMVVGALFGARLLYVLQNPELWSHPREAFSLWNGGLVSYGGLVGAVLAWLALLRYRRLPLARLSDALAPAALLGWAIGRIGCLLSWYGETGTVTTMPWGFVVDNEQPRHPVMLYLSLALFLGTAVVLRLEKTTDWPTTATALVAYGLCRGSLDFFRDYDPHLLMYTSQAFCLGLVATGLAILKWGDSRQDWSELEPEVYNPETTVTCE
ncbi:MAG: prolipoprotein diacylglyceryl transferase [Candidatus Eremiobacteraeota bacterium]|nr:prolipoprotein diacylglyceryl transferase [Candidatus Eremiobacteraeota bacterium]